MKEKETFKNIEGFDGYEISNLGRTRSFLLIKEGLILKTNINKYGYEIVNIRKNTKSITKYIHRLVAMAFIPNPENKPTINHKDGNKLNNYLNNLEWNTVVENIRHCHKYGLWKKRFGKNHWLSKAVFQYDLDGNIVNGFGGLREASRKTGLDRYSITRACKGLKKSYSGYIWKFKSHCDE